MLCAPCGAATWVHVCAVHEHLAWSCCCVSAAPCCQRFVLCCLLLHNCQLVTSATALHPLFHAALCCCACHCCLGSVVYDDGDTEHVTLQKERYKVLEGPSSLPPKPRPRSATKTEVAPNAPSVGQAGSLAGPAAAAKQQRNTASIPLAVSKPPVSKPASKQGSGVSAGAAAGGAAGQGATSGGGGAAAGKADGSKAAGRDDRERRPSGSGERDRAAKDASGFNYNKLPQLNMSHVSKKDREAARMLLGFSTPTGAAEVRAA